MHKVGPFRSESALEENWDSSCKGQIIVIWTQVMALEESTSSTTSTARSGRCQRAGCFFGGSVPPATCSEKCGRTQAEEDGGGRFGNH